MLHNTNFRKSDFQVNMLWTSLSVGGGGKSRFPGM